MSDPHRVLPRRPRVVSICSSVRRPAEAPRFSLDLPLTGLRLRVSGELDLATAARTDLLLAYLERTPRRLEVDLGAVTFLDAAGWTPFAASIERRHRAGRPPLRVSHASAAARRLLDLLGVERVGTADLL